LVSARGAWMRERFDNRNPSDFPLGHGYYGEWVGMASATWIWSGRTPLDFGFLARRPRESGNTVRYQNTAANPRLLDSYNGPAVRPGGLARQSGRGLGGAPLPWGGARGARHSLTGLTVGSPHAAAVLQLTKSTRLQLGWGEYAQFPEVSLLTSPLGGL